MILIILLSLMTCLAAHETQQLDSKVIVERATYRLTLQSNSRVCDYFHKKIHVHQKHSESPFFAPPPKKCEVLKVEINPASAESYSEVLRDTLAAVAKSDLIGPDGVAEIVVVLQAHAMHLQLNYTTAAWEVDAFVQRRPWWIINKEPFYNRHSPIVIRRYPLWEGYLRYLASVQYPEDCDTTPLIFAQASALHPGWSSIMYYTNRQRLSAGPSAIYNHFVGLFDGEPGPDETRESNKNAFADDSICPTPEGNGTHKLLNQWECAFIPLTHCPMPDRITNCTTRSCVQSTVNFEFDTTLMSNAGVNGAVIVTDKTDASLVSGDRGYLDDYGFRSHSIEASAPSEFAYSMPYDRALPVHEVHEGEVQPIQLIFLWAMMVRKNAIYRRRVAELIGKYRESTVNSTHGEFKKSSSCVAAHIRRGDRVMYVNGSAINMTQWCINATLYPGELHCVGEEGVLEKCVSVDDVYDFGCTTVPFASYDLSEVMEKARRLVGDRTRDLVVITDDPHWLEEQREQMRLKDPSWTVHALPFPGQTTGRKLWGRAKGDDKVRTSGGADAGTYFWAQIELASKCDGLVAHFGSGVAELLWHWMCFEHNGVCPPSFDWLQDQSKNIGEIIKSMREKKKKKKKRTFLFG